MLMKKILTVALVLCSLVSISQMPSRSHMGQGQMPTGRFYGKVVDVSNKAIEAASVTLVQTKMDTVTKKPKDIIVGGMLTSRTGDFSIENVQPFGRYKIRVSGIGFKPYEHAVAFDMPKRDGNSQGDPAAAMNALDKDLGNIKVEVDEKVLGSITVTASRPSVSLGIDRKIFNVERNITSVGGTAIDVMKNVPSVNVDIDGNVTLRNSSPQIFVDGRPTNLTLDQIPADAIETVEVITNPSAKFDASGGTAGILNITLKKNKKVGYNGSTRLNVDSRGKLGGGVDFNLRQNKVNFFASANFFQRKSISNGYTDRTSFGRNDTTYHFYQMDNNSGGGQMGFFRGGFDYLLDNRNTVTISGTLHSGKMAPFNTSSISLDTSAAGYVRNGYQTRVSNTDFLMHNQGLQFSYKHLFPQTGHELTADLTYYKGSNSSNNNIVNDYYEMPSKSYLDTYNQVQLGSGSNENIIAQTDYSNQLNDKAKIEMGLRSAIRTVNSANQYFTRSATGVLIPTAGNIIYNSNDKVYAGYATFTNSINKFGYQLGLRAESSDYLGNVPTKGQSFHIQFPVSLFPSVFLSEKFSDNEELQLNYSRKINRPNFFQLFPFIDSSDILNVSVGNPGLKPEFTNSLELSYSRTSRNRDNFLASIYFKNTTDLITRYQNIDTTVSKYGVINSYINANRSYVTGLELIGRNKITNWWDLTSNFNLFTAMIEVPNQPAPDQFPSYFLKLNNTFKLPKNFSLQLSGDYTSKIVSNPGGRGTGGGGMWGGGGGGMFGGNNTAAQGYINPNYGVDAALRFDFLKNKAASVSVNVNDIFKTKKYNAYSEALPYFTQTIERVRDPQIFRFNFSYRFGKFDPTLFKRKNSKADNGDDMNNMGQ
jgi:outer membrane receptor protein involved in Fe transport